MRLHTCTAMHFAGRLAPLAAALALAGCAGTGMPFGGAGGGDAAARSLPDLPSDGPAAATAVVETTYVVDGAILPVVRGQTRSGTRADMRRDDSLVSFDNRLISAFAGDGRSADIVRVDRRLLWTLDPGKRRYTECPITGCASASQNRPTERSPEQSKAREPDCPVTVKANDLKVTASGERKVVNGFPTERYQVAWAVDIEDGKGRRNTNRMNLDLWTTPETGAVREVQQINENFQRRYASALNTGDNPIGRYLPKDVMRAMGALMKNLDLRAASGAAGEMRKVRGYPIVTTMTWTSDGSVCSDSASPAGSSAPSLGALFSQITGGGAKPAAGAPSAPLISFSSEVKTLAVRPISDSQFVPPADYTRSQ